MPQFKTHIQGIMEIHSGAIFYAANYLLEKLNGVQGSFLREVGVDGTTAFLELNFTPPIIRRNIGMLVLLHKRDLGKAHSVFGKLLQFHVDCVNIISGDLLGAEL